MQVKFNWTQLAFQIICNPNSTEFFKIGFPTNTFLLFSVLTYQMYYVNQSVCLHSFFFSNLQKISKLEQFTYFKYRCIAQ